MTSCHKWKRGCGTGLYHSQSLFDRAFIYLLKMVFLFNVHTQKLRYYFRYSSFTFTPHYALTANYNKARGRETWDASLRSTDHRRLKEQKTWEQESRRETAVSGVGMPCGSGEEDAHFRDCFLQTSQRNKPNRPYTSC